MQIKCLAGIGYRRCRCGVMSSVRNYISQNKLMCLYVYVICYSVVQMLLFAGPIAVQSVLLEFASVGMWWYFKMFCMLTFPRNDTLKIFNAIMKSLTARRWKNICFTINWSSSLLCGYGWLWYRCHLRGIKEYNSLRHYPWCPPLSCWPEKPNGQAISNYHGTWLQL